MDEKLKYEILDKALKYLEENNDATIGQLSEVFNIEFQVMHSLIGQSVGEGFATERKIMADRPEHRGDAIIQLTQPGRYLILNKGGYTAIYNKKLSEEREVKRNKNIEKLYAIVLLVFTGAAAAESIHTIYTDKQIEKYSIETDKALKEVDSLRAKLLLVPDSLWKQ